MSPHYSHHSTTANEESPHAARQRCYSAKGSGVFCVDNFSIVITTAAKDSRPPWVRAMNPANPQRLLPSRQLVKRELDAGKLGEPGLIRIHHWEAAGVEADTAHELPAALLQQIDVILWLMGKSPTVVYAIENSEAAKARPGRYLQIHLGFPGDAMALLVYSSLHPPGDPYRSLHVIGSAGAAYADDQQNMQLLYKGGQPRGVMAQEILASGHDVAGMITDWDGVLHMAAAVLLSLQSRQAVSLEGR